MFMGWDAIIITLTLVLFLFGWLAQSDTMMAIVLYPFCVYLFIRALSFFVSLNADQKEAEEIREREETLTHFRTLSDLLSLTPSQFERLVEMLFESMGYSTALTKASGDKGVDIRLRNGDVLELVQCKRYTGNVPVATVREFLGVMVDHNVHKGFIVTTGHFSVPACEFASDKGIHLIDGTELVETLRSRNIGADSVT
ncbi:MAG: restriction endonuclease [candidate division Zixibacteria bacterium]|nr:restriction endonuclease [candidate division Zixibacteria bacterium]